MSSEQPKKIKKEEIPADPIFPPSVLPTKDQKKAPTSALTELKLVKSPILEEFLYPSLHYIVIDYALNDPIALAALLGAQKAENYYQTLLNQLEEIVHAHDWRKLSVEEQKKHLITRIGDFLPDKHLHVLATELLELEKNLKGMLPVSQMNIFLRGAINKNIWLLKIGLKKRAILAPTGHSKTKLGVFNSNT